MEKSSGKYAGRKVFVGIDVHRGDYQVACVCEGKVVKRCRMPGRAGDVVRFCRRHFAGAEIDSAYEAGFSGFVLHRQLCGSGIRNVVVHAGSVEVCARKRAKTDKRDSEKLAVQLAAGRLKGVRVPSEEEGCRRVVTRTRVRNQIRMRLHQFGLLGREARGALTVGGVREVLRRGVSRGVSGEVGLGIEALLRVWEAIEVEVKRMEGEMVKQGKRDPLDGLYRSVPGIGPVSARVLANELGGMRQFRNVKQLYSFTGLTPGEFSSGEVRRLGHITRQGAGRLRRLLVESAWVAVGRDAGLAMGFARIAARAGKKRAIVAIARKLAGRIRAVVLSGSEYRAEC